MTDQNKDLEDRINKLEYELIQQEHRTLRVFLNLWTYRNSQNYRSATIWALISWFFSPGVISSVGVSIVGIAGLYFAWDTNQKLNTQNYIINHQATLHNEQFIDDRSVVYDTNVTYLKNDISSIILQPIASEMTLQEGKIFLPSKVYSSSLDINQDGHVLHISSLEFDLKKYAKKRFSLLLKGKKGEEETTYHVILSIPVLIVSSYVAKNQRQSDTSLYEIKITSKFDSKDDEFPLLEFSKFTFLKRLDSSLKNPSEYIDELFDIQVLEASKLSPNSFLVSANALYDEE